MLSVERSVGILVVGGTLVVDCSVTALLAGDAIDEISVDDAHPVGMSEVGVSVLPTP